MDMHAQPNHGGHQGHEHASEGGHEHHDHHGHEHHGHEQGHPHGNTPPGGHGAHQAESPAAAVPDGTVYTCPMHPEVRQDHPGNCPKCGMTLEPVLPTLDEDENPELADFRRLCGDALAQQGTAVIWQRAVLEDRVVCYRENSDPRLAEAQADLAWYLAHEPSPLEQGLAPR